MSRLLTCETFLRVLRSFVFNEAIFLQQLHYWLHPNLEMIVERSLILNINKFVASVPSVTPSSTIADFKMWF